MTSATLFHGLDATVTNEVAAHLQRVEQELEVQTRSTVVTVEDVGTVTLQAGGKRLRPALVVLSALATGLAVDSARLAKLGACLELIHMATLVHDDVIDGATTRRGKPTAASLYGNTAAILSGDVLLARAMQLLADDGDIRVIRAVSGAVVDLAEGEVMELEARGDLYLTEDRHFAILEKKTASLISCCCRIGAMCVGARQTHEESLAAYGRNLGLAFQITDDLLDYAGNTAKTGKPLGTDFRDGQATLPVIDLVSNGQKDARDVLRKFGNGVTEADIRSLCKAMADTGALARARERARDFAMKAQGALTGLPTTETSRLLGSVATFVTERQA